MESKNPSVRAKTFEFTQEEIAQGTMTMSGAINKAGLLFLIMVATASVSWNLQSIPLMFIGAIGGLIAAFVVIFKKRSAPFVAPVYAAFEGLLLGALSITMEQRYPGIVGNALILTFSTLGLMLGCYRMGILRNTPVFQRVVVFATFALAITYVANFVMGFFGASIPMIHEASAMGIAFSVVATGVAALNLILDFDLFEKNADRSPKFMEWYCGFSLMVTIVWLYIEMLRLLSKLNRR